MASSLDDETTTERSVPSANSEPDIESQTNGHQDTFHSQDIVELQLDGLPLSQDADSSARSLEEREHVSEEDAGQADNGDSSDNGPSSSVNGDSDPEGRIIGYSSDHHTRDTVNPPPSHTENCRDALLRFLDRPEFQYLGIAVNVLIVADGAFFFFLLVGAHAMCDEPSRTDCDPRNWWYNWSVQVLCGLFSYMAIQSMPWRCTQFLHISGLSCPYRSHAIGKDLYGLPTDEVWYYITRWKRLGMISLLLLNCLTQFVNQGTRIVYSDYDSQAVPPGSIWTNVFFFGSMAFAAVAAIWQVYEEHQIRKRDPERFAPGPIALLQKYWRLYRCKCCQKPIPDERDEDEEGERVTDGNTRYNFGIPTFPQLPFDRTDLRLWGM